MTDYLSTKGHKIQYLTSDPTPLFEGQVWYNSTTATLKVRGYVSTGSWASGGNLSTARKNLGGAGTKTEGLAFC